MKLDQLSYFVETAKSQHVGKAAQILAISPSAISHSIAALEEEMGLSLFEKNGKRILLTESGKRLLEKAEPILNELKHLKEDLSHSSRSYQGFFKIAAGHQLAPSLVAPLCFNLQEEHPELQFEIQTFRSALVLNEVLLRQVDLGICYSPQEHPELAQKTLIKGDMYITVRRGHPLLKKPMSDRVSKLNQLSCIMALPSQGIQVCETHPVFKQHGIVLNVSAVCDNYEVALTKVKMSDAWAFLPEWVIDRSRGEVVKVKIGTKWKASYSISAIWHRKQVLSRSLEEILEGMEAQLKLS